MGVTNLLHQQESFKGVVAETGALHNMQQSAFAS